jgi:hypothetical protein
VPPGDGNRNPCTAFPQGKRAELLDTKGITWRGNLTNDFVPAAPIRKKGAQPSHCFTAFRPDAAFFHCVDIHHAKKGPALQLFSL